MSQIYQLLEKRYPDIAGSAQNVQSQKSKSIAMHKLELDADIIKGKPDHTKSSKFIADLPGTDESNRKGTTSDHVIHRYWRSGGELQSNDLTAVAPDCIV